MEYRQLLRLLTKTAPPLRVSYKNNYFSYIDFNLIRRLKKGKTEKQVLT